MLILSCKPLLELPLNAVAPVRMKIVSCKMSFPWIHEEIGCSRRLCCKVECLWKSTHLEVHRMHLEDPTFPLN